MQEIEKAVTFLLLRNGPKKLRIKKLLDFLRKIVPQTFCNYCGCCTDEAAFIFGQLQPTQYNPGISHLALFAGLPHFLLV